MKIGGSKHFFEQKFRGWMLISAMDNYHVQFTISNYFVWEKLMMLVYSIRR